MRVLVCGGRDFGVEYPEYSWIWQVLDTLYADDEDMQIISGMATGADTAGADWARARGVSLFSFPANWDKHGKAAGYIRNKQMLEEGKPDLVIAFPGGRGTANMIKLARDAGVPVEEVVYDG